MRHSNLVLIDCLIDEIHSIDMDPQRSLSL